MLALFKYWEFIRANLAIFAPSFASQLPRFSYEGTALPLPPGISFYTFESLSFVIDVYRRDVAPPKKPLEFFAFIGMFPRFIAGPIVRYKQLVDQFKRYPGMQLESGLFLFVLGLFIKTCFADQFAVFVPYSFERAEGTTIGLLPAWIGVLAYTFQIYFDFSGYSLMAIGIGRCLGFQFPTNFNRPYIADSIQDFWRRWHISLSTWLRDYLYISLGGNRKGPLRTYVNLILTMLIGGLWHGASWTYVIWGGWHGTWLALERATGWPKPLPHRLRQISTFLVAVVGWVFFRATTLGEAGRILTAMVSPQQWRGTFNAEALFGNPLSVGLCILGVFYCFVIEPRVPATALEEIEFLPIRARVVVLAMGAFALIIVFSARTIPFLYFQF